MHSDDCWTNDVTLIKNEGPTQRVKQHACMRGMQEEEEMERGTLFMIVLMIVPRLGASYTRISFVPPSFLLLGLA